MAVRFEQVEVDGQPMQVFIDGPDGPGPNPGIIVAVHAGGIDLFTGDVTRRLADKGYVTVTPDVFHVVPPGIEDYNEKRTYMTDTQVENDILAGISYLQKLPNVDPNRIGIVGHCMGGRMALQGAIVSDAFKVCVVYYGGHLNNSWGNEPKTPMERMAEVKCPVIGFFGLDDQNPSPGDVDKMEAIFKENNIEHMFHRYEGAGHGFQSFERPERYREEATQDSSEKMWAYMLEKLG